MHDGVLTPTNTAVATAHWPSTISTLERSRHPFDRGDALSSIAAKCTVAWCRLHGDSVICAKIERVTAPCASSARISAIAAPILSVSSAILLSISTTASSAVIVPAFSALSSSSRRQPGSAPSDAAGLVARSSSPIGFCTSICLWLPSEVCLSVDCAAWRGTEPFSRAQPRADPVAGGCTRL